MLVADTVNFLNQSSKTKIETKKTMKTVARQDIVPILTSLHMKYLSLSYCL